jgi:O-antigen/teichoic acid export membrane protein
MRGFGATALNPIATAIIQLGSVPILLHAWGATKYGDWLLLSAIPSYLTLSDLGLGAASGSDMSMRVAADDREGALETFQSSWLLITAISFVVLLLGLFFVWLVPWQQWLKLSSISSHEAAEVISVLGVYVVLLQQNGIVESGYRSDGYFATGTLWLTIQRLAEALAGMIVAGAGGSLLAVAFAYLAVGALGVIGYSLFLRRLSPWIRFGIRHVRLKTVRRMAVPAFGFMAFPLGYALSLQGFTIAIGSVLGPIAVVSFSTLRTLSRLSLQIAVVIKHGLWPELSRAFGTGDVSLARRLHRHACQASLALSAFGGSFLWLAGPYIYRLWIRDGVRFDAACFHILLLGVIVNSVWETSSVIPISTNAHCRIAMVYSGVIFLSLGLARVLMPGLGTMGAAVALLAADGCMAAIVLHTALSQVADTPKRFFVALFEVAPEG